VIVGFGATIALLAPLLAWSHLPEPLATHWSLRGAPNGSLPRAVALALFVGTIVVPAALSWRGASGPMGEQGPRLVAMLAFVSTLVAQLSVLTVWANWDRPHWRFAARLSPASILTPLVVSFLIQMLVGKLARRANPASDPPLTSDAQSLPLTEGERVFWAAHAENRWTLLSTAIPLLLAVAFAAKGAWVAAAGNALMVPLFEHFARIRVTVSAQRVSIHYGHLGFVRQRIDLSRIRHASALDLIPMAHGGWGYRGSLRLLGRAAIVIRRGSALQLELTNDRRLSITIDDAETAAALINGLVQRQRVDWQGLPKGDPAARPA
jgi:hypothetical protein